MEQTKVCTTCSKEKLLTEYYSRKSFSKEKGEYIYYHPECKDCTREKAYKNWDNNRGHYRDLHKKYEKTDKYRKWVRKHIKEMKEYHNNWLKENPDRQRLYNQRHAKKKHKITEKEWIMCKEFFNNACAYCGMTEKDHKIKYNQNLHKDHVIDDGRNDLKNCIPACRNCNSEKWKFSLNNWYNPNNSKYLYERYHNIYLWLRYEYKKYIQKKKIKQNIF